MPGHTMRLSLQTATSSPTWRAPYSRFCIKTRSPVANSFSSTHIHAEVSSSGATHAVISLDEKASYQAGVFKKMMGFMGPAVLIPLGDPIMALVDTIFVGQFAGTTQLAAMGPANMLFAFSLYIFRSLQVSTQSLVASHLRDLDRPQAARYLACGLGLAAVLGTITAGVLSQASLPLVLSTGVKDMALVEPSSSYLSIRALAMPAVLLTTVAQSGKLAQHDSLTPCLSVALTVLVSLVANVVFVGFMGWGLKGAAITTVGTQYLGAAVLMWAVHQPNQLKPDWSLPRMDQLMMYLHTMAPLTAVFVSKNICYLIASSAAACLATVAVAAHQAAFSLWTLFTWAMCPVEHACMAYLPSAKGLWQQQATGQLVLAMGGATSVAAGLLLAGLLVLGPGLLVNDPTVMALMTSIMPQAAVSLVLVGMDMAASSINLALRDFQYVARSYVVTLAATAAYFAACRSQGWGLPGVWWGLTLFFGMRCAQSLARAVSLLKLWPQEAASQTQAHTESEMPAGDGELQGGKEMQETVGEGEQHESEKGAQGMGGDVRVAGRVRQRNNVLPFPGGQLSKGQAQPQAEGERQQEPSDQQQQQQQQQQQVFIPSV